MICAEHRFPRRNEAAPLLAHLKDWLDAALIQVVPQSLTGKALGYLASRRACEHVVDVADDVGMCHWSATAS